MSNITRRAFLNRLGMLGAIGAVNPISLNLMGMAEAAAQTATDGYKALVCVFLSGGNDHVNTLVPVDNRHYSKYQDIRQNIALGQSSPHQLTPNTALSGGLQFGLHPSLSRLSSLFHLNKLAILQNVGTLLQPTDLDQFKNKSVPLPRMLFSHYDQQVLWRTTASEAYREGWGGRFGDMLMSQNGRAMFTCIDAAGESGGSSFLAGVKSSALTVNEDGMLPIWHARQGAWLHHSQKTADAMRQLITQPRQHIMENHLNMVTDRSMKAEKTMNGALKSVGELNTAFSESNRLAKQLRIVARLIKANQQLGVKRQVFYVGIGDFDTHDNLLETHAKQLSLLDEAMSSFYQATEELGMTDRVTTFTASDFGRTFSSNGDGSDHGWGGHQMIMGGAVKGRDFYGQTPEIGLNTPEDVGQGRLLPSTSIDQYTATLGRWFGVSDSDLRFINPNLSNFGDKDLGFMM